MCMPSSPKAPPPPPPLPAPPAPAILAIQPAEGTISKSRAALAAGKGRSRLRIDRTVSSTGSTGSGLNIPN